MLLTEEQMDAALRHEIRGSDAVIWMWITVWFGPTLAVLFGWLYSSGKLALPELVPFAAGAAILVAFLGTTSTAAAFYGVVPMDEGLLVRHRSFWFWRKPLAPRLVPWSAFRTVNIRMGTVQFDSPNPSYWMVMNYRQARAVLGDPRCPLSGRVPQKVARKLGLPASTGLGAT